MSKIGAKLKSAREAKGLSVYEISMTLKINAKVLIAIESDDFQNPILPSRIFIRGFIKSYSQLLKLNPDEFLQHFDEGAIEKKEVESTKQIESLDKEQFLEEPELPWKKILVLAVVLVVLIIVVAIAKTLSVAPPSENSSLEVTSEANTSTTLSNSQESTTTIPALVAIPQSTEVPTTTVPLATVSSSSSTTTSTSTSTTTTLGSPIQNTEVVIEAEGDLKILYGFSNQELKEISLTSGQIHRFKVKTKIRLEIFNSKAANVYVNGLKRESPEVPSGQALKLEIP